MEGKIVLQFFLFLLPALLTGIVAFYFFKLHTQNEDGRRRFLLHQDTKKDTISIRLQAYERMALFLERISITNLVVRLTPLSSDKQQYLDLLIRTVENELEHNISQQIYMSDECWNIIKTSKNITIQIIHKIAMNKKIETANTLREKILNEMIDRDLPTTAALSYIKKEVRELC